MRLLVCGHREFDDWDKLSKEIYALYDETPYIIIEGGAKGADFLARVWAIYNDYEYIEYPADWKKHGLAAGPIRNQQMLDEGKPDVVLAFLAKGSRGTKDMVDRAIKAGIRTIIIEI